jgi:hypothetical protein
MSLKQYIIDQKQKMFIRDNYTCQFPGCSKKAIEPAHCISQGKYAIKLVAKINQVPIIVAIKSIWHLNNIYSVCDNKAHNDYFNIHISQTIKFKEKLKELT